MGEQPHELTVMLSPLPTTRSGVLLAYSHHDRDLLGELQVHLKPLQKAWMLDLWDDLRLDGSGRSRQEFAAALAGARVVVVLVSPNLMDSPFAAEDGLPPLLAKQEHPRAAVMCLYLRATLDAFADFHFIDPHTREPRSVSLTMFRGLNDPLQPLAGQDRTARHDVLRDAATEIIAASRRGTVASNDAHLPQTLPG